MTRRRSTPHDGPGIPASAFRHAAAEATRKLEAFIEREGIELPPVDPPRHRGSVPMTRRAPEVADRHEALTAPHRARWEAEEIAALRGELDAAPEVHPLPPQAPACYCASEDPPMPTFRVYELQEEIRHRRWLYEIEAESAEEAIAKAKDADAEPVDCGEQGDSYFGRSGWSALPVAEADEVRELDEDGFAAATADKQDREAVESAENALRAASRRAACIGEAHGDGYPGSRFFHRDNPDCPGHA